MVGYLPVREDDLSLGMAKFVHGGVADHQRKLQIIFFTQQLSYTSQLRACGLQHQRPSMAVSRSKKSLPPRTCAVHAGEGPCLCIQLSVWMPESCRTWSGLTEVCRSIVERCQTEKDGGKLAAKRGICSIRFRSRGVSRPYTRTRRPGPFIHPPMK
jgi:hypothetical protein